MKIFKEHQKMLMRRESRVVMGRSATGLWLLAMVLTATFLSISFSAGSLAYLDEKMNDPFTFWLNVYRDKPSTNLRVVADELKVDSIRKRFLFGDVQTELATSIDMLGPKGTASLFTIQHYENMGNDLIGKVLGEENVLSENDQTYSISHDSIHSHSLGVIMTIDALERLGYSRDTVPSFVYLRAPANDADTLGFQVFQGGANTSYVRAPIPLLAVVRRLPMNKDVLASSYLNIQYSEEMEPEPFNLSKEAHARNLYFFVPTEIKELFQKEAILCIPDSLRQSASVFQTEESIQERLKSWKQGSIMTVYPEGRPSIKDVNIIEHRILDQFGNKGVERVYDYAESYREVDAESNNDNGLSIHFQKLDSIRVFENYMKDKWELQIEMSQVNAKENFNAVSTMANILTLALIVFSIIAIVLFVVNMLQSYFQKVKRNLGTFKAFGISTKELVMVYVTVVVGIVIMALAIALAVTWLAELLLPCFGLTKEGGAPHLILWNSRTLWAIAIILLCAVSSVLVVLRRLLRQTPGNLIYDR